MATETSSTIVYRPACQGSTPNQCSNCSLSYDCVRAREGRSVNWGLVALGGALVLGLVAKLVTG